MSRRTLIAGLTALAALATATTASARTDTVVDRSFGSRGVFSVHDGSGMVADRGGRLVVVRRAPDGMSVSRYLASGTPDRSFGGGDGNVVVSRPTHPVQTEWMASTVAIQPDGGIVVAGGVRPAPGPESEGGCHPYSTVLARLGSSGGLDWITDPEDPKVQLGTIEAIELKGRKILVGGIEGCGYEQGDSGFVARMNRDGTPDGTFAHGKAATTLPPVGRGMGRGRFQPFSDVNALLVGPNGLIYAAGSVRGGMMLARLTRNGGLDPRFGRGGIVRSKGGKRDLWEAQGLARDRSGRLLVSGVGGSLFIGLARYRPDGAPDRSFGQGGLVRTRVDRTSFGNGVAVQRDGRIVVAGFSRHPSRGPKPGEEYFLSVVRYTGLGSLDSSFFGDGVFTRRCGNGWFGASWRPTVDRHDRILVTDGSTAMRFRPSRAG